MSNASAIARIKASIAGVLGYTPVNKAGDTMTGALTLGGLLDVGATGQIKFPATQNPSSDANTLDDYEEGTWTPILQASSASPSSITYAEQFGRYMKVGKMVLVQFYIAPTSFSGGSGYLRIGGLPYASSSDRNPPFGGGAWYANNFQAAGTFPSISPVPGTNQLTALCFSNNGGWGEVQIGNLPPGNYFAIQASLIYQASS